MVFKVMVTFYRDHPNLCFEMCGEKIDKMSSKGQFGIPAHLVIHKAFTIQSNSMDDNMLELDDLAINVN